jgi:NADH:ubiquinone oxidoreductase subunit 6 (subunit J)
VSDPLQNVVSVKLIDIYISYKYHSFHLTMLTFTGYLLILFILIMREYINQQKNQTHNNSMIELNIQTSNKDTIIQNINRDYVYLFEMVN